MKRKTLQNIVVTGKPTLPIAILITIICWMIGALFMPDHPSNYSSSESDYAFIKLIPLETIPFWANQTASFILHLILGYFLITLNNTFGIIRVRASIQTCVYLMLVAACPAIHFLCPGNAAAVAMLLSIFFLFASYQHPNGAFALFDSFTLLGIGSLAFPQLVYFVPILWIGAFMFQSLTIKSFFASILGWSLPYWFFFGYAFFTNQMELFYRPFLEIVNFHTPQLGLLQSWEIATLSFCLILYIVSVIYVFTTSYSDKIRTRMYLRFLILICLCLFAFILLQPAHCIDLISLLFVFVSILIGHMFALSNTKASNLFFIGAVVGLIGLLYYNIWMLL